MALLQGCGESKASTGDPTPAGVFLDSTLTPHLKTAFDEVKACTQLPEGSFAEATVIVMPPTFVCQWHDGQCSGEFVPPNTIKLGSPYVWKHEVIHFLLYRNTGQSDPTHQSPFFQTCVA